MPRAQGFIRTGQGLGVAICLLAILAIAAIVAVFTDALKHEADEVAKQEMSSEEVAGKEEGAK